MKNLCCLHKNKLKKVLIKYLYSKGYHPIYTDDYIIAEGLIPIGLVAHIDTVFNHIPSLDDFIYDNKKQILWHPKGSGFDDRAGIYAILQILDAGLRPNIIFTDMEEKGGIGAQALATRFPQIPFFCKCLIQLDRANEQDMVFYDCDNREFTQYIGQFKFKENFGSFSDISILAPQWGIAAVNLSIGYVDEHTSNERLYCSWCDKTIEKVKRILEKHYSMPKFEYIPFQYNYNNFISIGDGVDTCLICGQKLDKSNYMICVQNPYNICEKCFNLYYDKSLVPYMKNSF